MIVEYLLVVFKGSRMVLADDEPVGVTNHILMLPPDDYVIALDGSPAVTPATAEIALAGTSPVHPRVVLFT